MNGDRDEETRRNVLLLLLLVGIGIGSVASAMAASVGFVVLVDGAGILTPAPVRDMNDSPTPTATTPTSSPSATPSATPSLTASVTPPPIATPTATRPQAPDTPTWTPTLTPTTCDPAYPDVCIPPPPPTLNCDTEEVPYHDFRVIITPDPHGLDGDGDGIGCESRPRARINSPSAGCGPEQPANADCAYDGFDDEAGLHYADLVLRGSATDDQDGELSGESLVWTTDRSDVQDPNLGTGTSVSVRLYGTVKCEGQATHRISLAATDSAGNTISTVRPITLWALC